MAMTSDATQTRFADLRIASGLICAGTGLLLLGLGAALVLVLYYFLATQFGHSSAAVAAKALGEVWPWAEPVLDIEGFGVALDALGLAVLAAPPRRDPTPERRKAKGAV
jgi:hypothetical protein